MGEQVPLREAARRLGVSPDTVRRRMKAGTLEAEKRPTPQGGEWWITLPDDVPPAGEPDADAADARAGAVELATLRGQVTMLEARVEELRDERNAWREQAVASREAEAQLRVLVQQAQSLAGALPAATGEQAYAAPMPTHGQADVADVQPAKRSWRVLGLTISR